MSTAPPANRRTRTGIELVTRPDADILRSGAHAAGRVGATAVALGQVAG